MSEEIPIGRVTEIREDGFTIVAPIENLIRLLGKARLLKLLEDSGYDVVELGDSLFVNKDEE